MFYCDECMSARGWPGSIGKSLGRCEVCGFKRQCNDVASSLLPTTEEPPAPATDITKLIEEARAGRSTACSFLLRVNPRRSAGELLGELADALEQREARVRELEGAVPAIAQRVIDRIHEWANSAWSGCAGASVNAASMEKLYEILVEENAKLPAQHLAEIEKVYLDKLADEVGEREAKLAEVEAGAAAMRQALEAAPIGVRNGHLHWDVGRFARWLEECAAALADPAGQSFLERLRRAELAADPARVQALEEERDEAVTQWRRAAEQRDYHHAAVMAGDQPCQQKMAAIIEERAALAQDAGGEGAAAVILEATEEDLREAMPAGEFDLLAAAGRAAGERALSNSPASSEGSAAGLLSAIEGFLVDCTVLQSTARLRERAAELLRLLVESGGAKVDASLIVSVIGDLEAHHQSYGHGEGNGPCGICLAIGRLKGECTSAPSEMIDEDVTENGGHFHRVACFDPECAILPAKDPPNATVLPPRPFRPVAPGELLSEELRAKRISHPDAAHRLGLTEEQLARLLAGDHRIDDVLAIQLGRLIKTSASYWQSLQAEYDRDLALLPAPAKEGAE